MIALSNQYVATFDTSVLPPVPPCDTLLLAEDPTFYIPTWSDDILRRLRSSLQRMADSPARAGRPSHRMEDAKPRVPSRIDDKRSKGPQSSSPLQPAPVRTPSSPKT